MNVKALVVRAHVLGCTTNWIDCVYVVTSMFLVITDVSVIVYVSAYALLDVIHETTSPDYVINVVERPNADVIVIVLTMSVAEQ